MDAVEAGRSYITMGYEVEVLLWDGLKTYGIGDTLATGEYTLNVKCRKAKDYPYESNLEKSRYCFRTEEKWNLNIRTAVLSTEK